MAVDQAGEPQPTGVAPDAAAHVRAAVAEYTEQLLPLADMRAVAQEMEANLYNLALHSPNGRVRLQASQALIAICERREEQQRAGHRTINVAALFDELSQRAPGQPEAIDRGVVENKPTKHY